MPTNTGYTVNKLSRKCLLSRAEALIKVNLNTLKYFVGYGSYFLMPKLYMFSTSSNKKTSTKYTDTRRDYQTGIKKKRTTTKAKKGKKDWTQ